MKDALTAEQIANEYKARIERTYAQRGAAEAIQRGVSMLCSWSLGREFGETCESHDAKHPEYDIFRRWFQEYRKQIS